MGVFTLGVLCSTFDWLKRCHPPPPPNPHPPTLTCLRQCGISRRQLDRLIIPIEASVASTVMVRLQPQNEPAERITHRRKHGTAAGYVFLILLKGI